MLQKMPVHLKGSKDCGVEGQQCEQTEACVLCRCFREIERVDYIMEVLTRCRHNGFPVVRSGLGDDEDSGDFDAAGQGASRSGSLQGIILRSQILVMLRHQVSAQAVAHAVCFAIALSA